MVAARIRSPDRIEGRRAVLPDLLALVVLGPLEQLLGRRRGQSPARRYSSGVQGAPSARHMREKPPDCLLDSWMGDI